MSLQSPSMDTEKRVFPRRSATRPVIPPPPLAPSAPGASGALLARVRSKLALSGIGLGSPVPVPPPRPAAHRDPVLALVQRITQGFHPAEYERAKAMGYEAYLEEQL